MTTLGGSPALGRAIAAFEAAFGHQPDLAARAPGRLNLIGEHLDYNGGQVLPIAIDRDCVCVGRIRRDDEREVRVVATDADAADGGRWSFRLPSRESTSGLRTLLEAPAPEGCRPGNWRSYVAGVFHFFSHLAAARADVRLPGLDVAIATDVPLGAGLSSSASLELSLGVLLNAACAAAIEGLDLARIGRDAEHAFAGSKCGLMDQAVSALAHEGQALWIDFSVEPPRWADVSFPEAAEVLVVDSGVRHRVTGKDYASRVEACREAAAVLRVDSLASVTPERLAADEALLPAELRPLARHVVKEQARVGLAVGVLARGELRALGGLMTESHRSLRDQFRVSCPELDLIVDTAMGHTDAWGARMTGAGFGGCAIVLTPRGSGAAAATTIRSASRGVFERDPVTFLARPSGGASEIKLSGD